ncbi:MG2 domain-containing protein [Flavobacteriales bacterium]|nr:MG2 domain-containing protein [Flavobacteriales bacterium]
MKKLFSSIIKISSLFGLILLLAKCSNREIKPIDPAFAGYVTAFTSGVISNSSTIQIRLAESNPNSKINSPVDQDLFNLSPNVKGTAVWVDDRTIEFRPNKMLKSGKLYEVEFALGKLTEVPEKLTKLIFHVEVMKQAMDVAFSGMEAYDTDLKWQMMLGNVSTYDVANVKVLESAVSAFQNGKKLSLSWEHSRGGKDHRFVIDSVKRTEDRGQVVLQWHGGELGIEGDFDRTFDVPPLGEFSVLDVQTTMHPEQVITVLFSDPISTKSDLEGLVYLQPNAEVKTVREGSLLKIYPSKRLLGDVEVFVTDGVRNSLGYQLMHAYQKKVIFTSIKPAVELIGKGVIMPSTNGLTFPFKAVSLRAVNVRVVRIYEDNVAQFFQANSYDGTREMKRVGRPVFSGEIELSSENPIDYGSWNNFSIDLAKIISPEPGALYRVYLSFKKSQSLYPCEEDDSSEPEDSWGESDPEEGYDNPSRYSYYDERGSHSYGRYEYAQRDNPCSNSYYMRGERFKGRNILASDLGIIAKSGRGTDMLVAITDLRSTKPQPNVEVEIYNYQQQKIGSAFTDENGFANIDLNRKPYLLIAKRNKQRGYLRLDDGSALSMSMFDIGGQTNNKGVKGFMYGERGVWRPGDSLFISFILQDENKILPPKHPVVFELYTPRQQLFERIVRTTSVNGFYDFRTATEIDDPTGNWKAKVKVGGSVFTKTIKIETVKPNRLKIKVEFDSEILTNTSESNGNLEVKWLHGAIAGNLKADVELNLTKGSTSFKNYPGYTFDDLAKTFKPKEKMVFEGRLDKDGKAVVQPKIEVHKSAPGMLRANFKVRAFEKGGEFSVDRFSIPYSPYRGYVGVKIPKGKGWNGAIYSNEPHHIPIVTVDENGNPVNRKGVKIEVFDVYWRWWWERNSENDLARYVGNHNRHLVKSVTIDTKDGKAIYELDFGDRQYGRKFIRVTDPETGHSTGQVFYVTYKGWWNDDNGSSPGAAELLAFSTDKKKYAVGEKVIVTVPSSQQGRILASVETGSKILKSFWVDLQVGQNKFELETTEDMAPNAYVHLTLIQPHNNVKNDLPIRLYGIQPISIENPNSHLNPVISIPKELAPESTFEIKVNERSGKRMTYTLAVVDEGLLDLTRFKTPDPWSHFYSKEALSVRTWDMYKYVIGAFSGEMAGLLALGGDEYSKKHGGAKANRFKPVVRFIGPFELEANKVNTHRINMPNYVGSVRTMVVAGQGTTYGSTQKTTLVKKPLMVLATVPRVVGPTEKVEIPITVFAMDKSIKNVSVTIETNKFFEANGEKTKTVAFKRVGDQVVHFNLSVSEMLGIGTIKVIAKSGNHRAEYNVELDIRTPNPRITRVTDGMIEPGEKWTAEFVPHGMAGTNNGIVEASTIPSLNLESRLQYLMRYPHGCIEQTTSSVFPQLFLNNLMELSPEQKSEIEENIKAGIDRLKGFQIYSGGLSYWPGGINHVSDWGTNYAGHFMIEAKNKGYHLPPTFLENWVKFQKQRANSWTADMSTQHNYYYSSGHLIQAYRLYTLALAGSPALGAMNRMRTINNLSLAARWRLAAAYQLIGRTKIAENLVAGKSMDIKTYRELGYSYGTSERDNAMILETLSLMKRKADGKRILDKLAKSMASSRWYSTQTTAYTLLAAAKFVGESGGVGKNLSYTFLQDGEDEIAIETKSPISQRKLNIRGTESGTVVLENTGSSTVFVKLQLDGIPTVGDQTNSESNLKMKVRYTNLDFEEIDPSIMEQGSDLIAEITVTHPGIDNHYQELALTQIFPSGWEIRNLRMDKGESNKVADEPEYQDIRDDRIYTYFDLNRSQSKTFRVILNATYLGDFYLPTVVCEAMYDNDINSHKAGKWVRVVEAGSASSNK